VGVVAGRILAHEATNGVERYLACRMEHDPATSFGRAHPPWAAGGNAFYRRAVFEQLGPFDAGMNSGGDVEMSWRAQLSGGWKLVMCREAIVWHRHACTLQSMLKQQKRYGMGRVQIFQRHPQVQPYEGAMELYWRWRLLAEQGFGLVAQYRALSRRKGWKQFCESPETLLFLQRLAYNWGRLCGSVKYRVLYP
jgi:GT2 family glycosyltransferase